MLPVKNLLNKEGKFKDHFTNFTFLTMFYVFLKFDHLSRISNFEHQYVLVRLNKVMVFSVPVFPGLSCDLASIVCLYGSHV